MRSLAKVLRGRLLRLLAPGERRDSSAPPRAARPKDDVTPEGCAPNDVFIIEGEQERYGDKSAWEVVRRY